MLDQRQEQDICIKPRYSRYFGCRSGVFSAIGLLPHIVALFVFFMIGARPLLIPIVGFTIVAKVFGEYLFWQNLYGSKNEFTQGKDWRSILSSLFSHANIQVSLVFILVDVLSEGVLISMALRTPLSPFLVFLVFLTSQALAAPFVGIYSDVSSRKKSLIFASLITLIILAALAEIGSGKSLLDASSKSVTQLLWLHHLTLSTQMLILLFAKAIFGNCTVIAKGAIAAVIKEKTQKKWT